MQRSPLYIVDKSLPDYEALVAQLPAASTLVLIDADQDGFQQLLTALGDISDVDTIHLYAHSADGQISLGTSVLDSHSLGSSQDLLKTLSAITTEDAEMLVYGCNLASTPEGKHFVDALASATGLNIAASDDLSGIFEIGGDWELEYQTAAVSAALGPTYSGLLGSFTWSAYQETDVIHTYGQVDGNGVPVYWSDFQVIAVSADDLSIQGGSAKGASVQQVSIQYDIDAIGGQLDGGKIAQLQLVLRDYNNPNIWHASAVTTEIHDDAGDSSVDSGWDLEATGEAVFHNEFDGLSPVGDWSLRVQSIGGQHVKVRSDNWALTIDYTADGENVASPPSRPTGIDIEDTYFSSTYLYPSTGHPAFSYGENDGITRSTYVTVTNAIGTPQIYWKQIINGEQVADGYEVATNGFSSFSAPLKEGKGKLIVYGYNPDLPVSQRLSDPLSTDIHIINSRPELPHFESVTYNFGNNTVTAELPETAGVDSDNFFYYATGHRNGLKDNYLKSGVTSNTISFNFTDDTLPLIRVAAVDGAGNYSPLITDGIAIHHHNDRLTELYPDSDYVDSYEIIGKSGADEFHYGSSKDTILLTKGGNDKLTTFSSTIDTKFNIKMGEGDDYYQSRSGNPVEVDLGDGDDHISVDLDIIGSDQKTIKLISGNGQDTLSFFSTNHETVNDLKLSLDDGIIKYKSNPIIEVLDTPEIIIFNGMPLDEEKAPSTNAPPFVNKRINDNTFYVGEDHVYQIDPDTFGDENLDTLTYSLTTEGGQAPGPWVSFNPDTFELEILPGESEIGQHPLRLNATDEYGQTTYDSFTIAITDSNLDIVQVESNTLFDILNSQDYGYSLDFTSGSKLIDSYSFIPASSGVITVSDILGGEMYDYKLLDNLGNEVASTLSLFDYYNFDVFYDVGNFSFTSKVNQGSQYTLEIYETKNFGAGLDFGNRPDFDFQLYLDPYTTLEPNVSLSYLSDVVGYLKNPTSPDSLAFKSKVREDYDARQKWYMSVGFEVGDTGIVPNPTMTPGGGNRWGAYFRPVRPGRRY